MKTGQAWGTMPAAAEYAGVGKARIRRWMKNGLKHSRLPTGRVLIRFVDIDSYLERYQVDEEAVVNATVNEILRDMRV